jgi:hypothetical protein
VPAYFNDAQRQATKDAGAICGLNVCPRCRLVEYRAHTQRATSRTQAAAYRTSHGELPNTLCSALLCQVSFAHRSVLKVCCCAALCHVVLRCAAPQVLRIINEPTAAAIAYGLDKGTSGGSQVRAGPSTYLQAKRLQLAPCRTV